MHLEECTLVTQLCCNDQSVIFTTTYIMYSQIISPGCSSDRMLIFDFIYELCHAERMSIFTTLRN